MKLKVIDTLSSDPMFSLSSWYLWLFYAALTLLQKQWGNVLWAFLNALPFNFLTGCFLLMFASNDFRSSWIFQHFMYVCVHAYLSGNWTQSSAGEQGILMTNLPLQPPFFIFLTLLWYGMPCSLCWLPTQCITETGWELLSLLPSSLSVGITCMCHHFGIHLSSV